MLVVVEAGGKFMGVYDTNFQFCMSLKFSKMSTKQKHHIKKNEASLLGSTKTLELVGGAAI